MLLFFSSAPLKRRRRVWAVRRCRPNAFDVTRALWSPVFRALRLAHSAVSAVPQPWQPGGGTGGSSRSSLSESAAKRSVSFFGNNKQFSRWSRRFVCRHVRPHVALITTLLLPIVQAPYLPAPSFTFVSVILGNNVHGKKTSTVNWSTVKTATVKTSTRKIGPLDFYWRGKKSMSHTVWASLCSCCSCCVVPRYLEWHEAGWYYVLIHQFFSASVWLESLCDMDLLLVLKPLTGVTHGWHSGYY